MECPQCAEDNSRSMADEGLPEYEHCNVCGSEWKARKAQKSE